MVALLNGLEKEIQNANFGDARLAKRFADLLNGFMSSPNKSIPGTFKSWKETLAAYRFFNHENVTETEILKSHQESTLERIKREKVVLIPQDTTEIDFTGRKPIQGMGYLSQEKSQGFFLHPSLAITPERSCLGVVDMQSWIRKELGTKKLSRKKPIEEKESYYWLKSYESANAIAQKADGSTIVSIADREGDIYELLEKMPSETNKAYWLVRCHYNRMILDKEEKALEQRLREKVRAEPPVGEITFEMTAGPRYRQDKKKRRHQEARTVRQAVRICRVTIQVPEAKRKTSKSTTLNVVHCCEINPPSEEDKIEWFLLTSYPVEDTKTAIEVVNWYLCRWMIEIFFKVLKSGCTIEELQFETLKATKNCIALYLIVAWRILYLTMLGRQCPDMNCDLVFEASEWQAVYMIIHKKPPPSEAPALNEMIIMIAKLGGFLGRKSDGYPGPQVMWIGIQRMKDFTLAWETFHPIIKRDQTYV
jgi:Transposase Tn5 dimerisation domain/Transposase DNA-binding